MIEIRDKKRPFAMTNSLCMQNLGNSAPIRSRYLNKKLTMECVQSAKGKPIANWEMPASGF